MLLWTRRYNYLWRYNYLLMTILWIIIYLYAWSACRSAFGEIHISWNFKLHSPEYEIANQKIVHTISFFPFLLFALFSTTSLITLTQKSGVISSAVLELQQCFLNTHFWHVWIKFYCSVNSFYCIHLCSAQPSPWGSLWRKSTKAKKQTH